MQGARVRIPAFVVLAIMAALAAAALLLTGSITSRKSGPDPLSDPAPPPPGRAIVIRKSADGLRFGLRADDAALRTVIDRLAAELDWVITLDESIGDRRVTLDIGLREPERLLAVLMRRANLALTLKYRLCAARDPDDDEYSPLPAAFGGERVAVRIAQPTPISQIGPALGVNLSVDAAIDRPIRMVYRGRPLRDVLAEIAQLTGGLWEISMIASASQSGDSDADGTERMRTHFSDLSRLSPEDRREEILADVADIERMEPGRQAEGIARMASDIGAMAAVLQTVHGEHREAIAGRILTVARDYYDALSGLPVTRRQKFDGLASALNTVAAQVRALAADAGSD